MCGTRLGRWASLVSVEPTMVLYMMAYMTTSVVEQAFFVDRACRVNHNFSDEICDNINAPNNANYSKIVQVTVSEFHQWNDIAGHAVPIVLALFMGAWSDRRGRKLPLVMGLVGKLYYSSMFVVNTTQRWPVEYVIYTATIPMAFTGADVAIFAAAFAYLTDVSSQESRTLRVTILEVCYLAPMPIGTALGKVLFTATNRSYTVMFVINVALLVASILYSLVFLRWLSNDRQRSVLEADNVVTDFFDADHVVQTCRTLCRRRSLDRRSYLVALIVCIGLYAFQRDERGQSFLYFTQVLRWSFGEYSDLRTFISALQDVVLLLAIPALTRLCGWRDTSVMMLGAVCHSSARIFYAHAEEHWLMYLGGAFAAAGPMVAPVIRSIVSKIVSTEERGKAFSLLSVMDNAIPLVSGTIYNQIYKATVDTVPYSIFYVTIATQALVFLIGLYIHCKANGGDLSETSEAVEELA